MSARDAPGTLGLGPVAVAAISTVAAAAPAQISKTRDLQLLGLSLQYITSQLLNLSKYPFAHSLYTCYTAILP